MEKMGQANRQVVFDLVEDLRAAWEKILNDYADGRTSAGDLQTERGGVRYVDAMMAVHNFHKLALDNIVNEDNAALTGEPAAQFFLGAGATFSEAMEARARQCRAKRSP